MSDIEIRTATAADIPGIAAIYRPAVEKGSASFELDPPDDAEMRKRFDAISGAGYPYIVAVRAGRVLGYAYASAYRTRPGYRFTVEDSIYVDEAAQGQGIGARLLDQLIVRATANGYRQMIAVIGDSMNWGSIAVHRKAGFTFVGTIHSIGFKHGRWLDSVLMQRALGPGDTSTPV